jgi:hypothetical protein
MNRKICEKILNFFYNIFLNIFGMDRTRSKKKLGWDRPKIKLSQNRPKKKTFFLQGWTQPNRMDWNIKVQPKKIAGYCAKHSNQLIIIN